MILRFYLIAVLGVAFLICFQVRADDMPSAAAPSPSASPSSLTPAGSAEDVAKKENPILTGDQVFSESKDAVLKLVTRLKGGAAARSHGTAFYVSEKGHLVTNYHVVWDYLEAQEKYDLVALSSSGSIPAVVIYIDPIHDLALLSTSQPAPLVLKPTASSEPKKGETIFSIGFPKSEEISVIQGNFNGVKAAGVAQGMAASMPLNPGMSGGPLFNRRGELIGVNRSMHSQAQSISYFSPLQSLREIIEKIRSPKDLEAFKNNWRLEIARIIQSRERALFARAPAAAIQPQRLGNLRFKVPADAQSCVQDSSKSAYEMMACNPLELARTSSSTSALELRTRGLFVKGSETKTAFDTLKVAYNSSLKSAAPGKGKTDLRKCSTRNLRNQNGIEMLARICSFPIKGFQGLYSSYLKLDFPQTDYHISFAQSFEGISLETTAKLVDMFVESFEQDGT